MNIGVIGTGHVGSALSTGLADKGHIVMLGSREPLRPCLLDWMDEDPVHRRVGDMREAASFGDIVVVASPGRLLADVLDATGRDAFAGKVVIDTTNPFAKDERGETIDFYGNDDSGAEFLQRELPDSMVVKAFNQILATAMLRPEKAEMDVLRIAGDDEGAKRRVAELAESFGWKVRDLGALKKARALERGVIKHFG